MFPRPLLLIVLGLSVLATLAALGYQYWDVVMAGLFAALAWGRKLMSLGGLLMLLKNAPILLVAGFKKLLLKILGGLMLLSMRTRFRPVRLTVVGLKYATRRMVRRLRFHWQDLGPLERTVALAVVLPAGALVILFVVLFITPRPLQLFATGKLQAVSGETLLRRLMPRFLRKIMADLHHHASRTVRERSRRRDDDETG